MSSEQAQQVLSTLEQRLVEVTNAATKLQEERRRIAFDANTGDEKARKTLDNANAASATAALEIENVRSAIEEAKRRLAEAGRAEEIARLGANAEQALLVAETIAQRGRKIDEALAIVAAESTALGADISTLNGLGFANPRAEQFTVLGERAFSTAMMSSSLKLRHLAPGERKTFTEICTGWRDTIARGAGAILEKREAA